MVLIVPILCVGVEKRAGAQVSPAIYTFTGNSGILSETRFRRKIPGEGLTVGPLRFHPFLGVAEVYTDNAFRVDTNKQSDFVHTISPGIQGQLKLGKRHEFLVDYRAHQQYSQRFSVNNVLSQEAFGLLTLDFPGDLTVDLQGGHVEGFDPRGSVLDIQENDITTWNTNTFLGRVEWFGSSFGLGLTASSTSRNFENNNQALPRDRWSHTANFTIFGSITSKTSALLNFGLEKEIYDQNKQLDSFTYGVSAGLRWSVTGKTTGNIRAGYSVLNFDRARVEQPSGSELNSGGDKVEALSITGDFRWSPTTRLNINIRPFRSIEQSAVFDTSTFVRTGVFIRARQAIGARTSLTGTFRFSQDEFEEDDDRSSSSGDRRDFRVLGGIGIDYRAVRWLGIRFNYNYEQRNSNFDRFDFYANTIMISIQGLL